MELEQWSEFWNNVSDPKHASSDHETFEKYSSEILFFLKGATKIVDTGCGSGEILELISPHFQKVFGIDYSKSMIDAANLRCEKIVNVTLIHGNMIDIAKLVNEEVDCIYNNGVIQYISHRELEAFIDSALSILSKRGRIVFMNIPDRTKLDLYGIGFFREWQPQSFSKLMAKYIRYKFWVLRRKLKDPQFRFDRTLGYWYTFPEIKGIAESRGLKADFYYSMNWPYGYRFHCVLSLNEQ
jgi:cyclopropane fatty-acyl-phospholipid synthase-like methyltransferase